MTQDNDPWGNKPRNTEGNELGAVLDKLKNSFFGGGGRQNNQHGSEPSPSGGSGLPKLSGKALAPIAVLGLLGWGASGIYILPEGFHGVELAFGRYTETAVQPGFNFHKPFPIGAVKKVDTGSLKNLTVGGNNRASAGQMLTSDENIVEVSLSVQYRIGKAEDYLFNVNEPEKVLRETLISSIREVVGGNNVDYILTNGRAEWPNKVRENLIETLDGFNVGFHIARVELRDAKAPAAVQEAFDDAVKAREDAERYKLQAEAYRNKKIPLARGEAKQILEQAAGYKESVIAKATGEAQRFDEILKTYQLAPQVTRDRMYIDTLQKVYASVNNIVVATGDNAPMLYLPVDKGAGQPSAMPLPTPAPQPTAIEQPRSYDSLENNMNGLDKPATVESNKRLTR